MQTQLVLDPKEIKVFAKTIAAEAGYIYKSHRILLGDDKSINIKVLMVFPHDKKSSAGFITRKYL